ncbi:GpE family phage tail protein [Novosphingobium sp. UBA1939]|nr:GpE family phage tail protein [Novosphingobium sp. UBA1939]
MIADIAAVFHWPIADLLAMDFFELCRWRRLAVARWNRMQGQE